jgi:hypothetical protein
VSSRRLWMRFLGVLVSCSCSFGSELYKRVVTKFDDDGELAGQLSHMDRHCDRSIG